MTSKQEQGIIKKLQIVKDTLIKYDNLVYDTSYNEIKQLQDEINYLLNDLVCCDTE